MRYLEPSQKPYTVRIRPITTRSQISINHHHHVGYQLHPTRKIKDSIKYPPLAVSFVLILQLTKYGDCEDPSSSTPRGGWARVSSVRQVYKVSPRKLTSTLTSQNLCTMLVEPVVKSLSMHRLAVDLAAVLGVLVRLDARRPHLDLYTTRTI